MNAKMLDRMKNDKGFIAALDQSGGSTPRALKAYGVGEDAYKNDAEMFDMVHAMRTRIIKSKSFTSEHILGAILFEMTMDREIDGIPTAQYLWEKKGIVPFLKIDKGLKPEEGGVQMFKPMPELDKLLEKAKQKGIFGTKERTVIKTTDADAIERVVAEQFDVAKKVIAVDLVPIIEPEIDIKMEGKADAEAVLAKALERHLAMLPADSKVIFKLTLPEKANLYENLVRDERVVRVVALSGGYSREKAVEMLAQNKGVVASFSRAFTEGLNVNQTDEEFDALMAKSIKMIYDASCC